jgi:ADP-heptose:LPS heptosyltransferase
MGGALSNELPSNKLLLVNHCSPGDVLMLTAALRDLHGAYPGNYLTGVDTRCPDLWTGNPYITPVRFDEPGVRVIDCKHPPLLDQCNGQPRHYIESIHHQLTQVLGREVPLKRFAPDLHLLQEEMLRPPLGVEPGYWVIVAGGKQDVSVKWWQSSNYQAVVDHFQGQVSFVQAGAASDHHPPLRDVINLVGRTSLREFVRLIYHADGVVCPITAAMHIAAAFDKPCVVIAGGREPAHWEMYPGHQYLHTIGQLSCCRLGGCWKARVVRMGDGDQDRDNNLCERPVEHNGSKVAACMDMIEPVDVCRAIDRYRRSIEPLSVDLNESNAQVAMQAAIARLRSYPGGFEGRGIVIPGGGLRYFPCAWVCINTLRDLGCKLPIELWYLGAAEMTDSIRELLAPLGVTCVDAREVQKLHPARILNGFEVKPYAILHSQFREVLLLDADNVPVVDPTFLFDTPQYLEHGAVFWPDFGRLGPHREIWRLTGVAYRDEREFESGQIVVNREKCWDPLALTVWMNEHSDFWYRFIHGDKDTFHIAWHKMGVRFAMPARGIDALDRVMCQHDFDGRRIFQHRNMAKWSIEHNDHIGGFQREDECLAYLAQLQPHIRALCGFRGWDEQLAVGLTGNVVSYNREGVDIRPIVLKAGGSIGDGGGRMERCWAVRPDSDGPTLEIYGDDGVTARLKQDARHSWLWKGSWVIHEKMPLEISVHRAQSIIDVVQGLNRSKLRGAEVGVYCGETSALLLGAFPGLTLLMVDAWTAAEADSVYAETEDVFTAKLQSDFDLALVEAYRATAFGRDRTVVIRADLRTAADFIQDETLDFVFLDADHSYEGTLEALDAWRPKVRVGGLICGHDYEHPNERFGVDRAVNELAEEFGTPPVLKPDYFWAFTKPGCNGQ